MIDGAGRWQALWRICRAAVGSGDRDADVVLHRRPLECLVRRIDLDEQAGAIIRCKAILQTVIVNRELVADDGDGYSEMGDGFRPDLEGGSGIRRVASGPVRLSLPAKVFRGRNCHGQREGVVARKRQRSDMPLDMPRTRARTRRDIAAESGYTIRPEHHQ